MKENNIGLILIQIEEAHSVKWKTGFVDHPENHKSFEHRLQRAMKFKTKYSQFENVYVDNWTNDFENIFQAWPDKFVFVNKELQLLEKSEYDMDAVITTDYTKLIEQCINENK